MEKAKKVLEKFSALRSFDISRHCFIDSIVNQSIFTATLYSLKTSCHTTEEETIAEEAAAEVTEGE
jgi:hypothetical protein